MGIYFESTTNEEDAEFIMNGIKNGNITTSYMWPDYDEEPTENDIVWKPTKDGNVVIHEIPGKLTKKGERYIMMCLMRQGRSSSTL